VPTPEQSPSSTNPGVPEIVGGTGEHGTISGGGASGSGGGTGIGQGTGFGGGLDFGGAIGLDEPPKVVFKVLPKYPELARKAGKEGIVILKILITRTGRVAKVVVLSAPGKLGFAEAAVEAVQQWKFEPPTVNGEPVDVWCTLPIRFKLE